MARRKEQQIQQAEKLVAKGKIEAAIKEYRSILKRSGEDTNTLNRVGDLYARIDKKNEAINFYGQTAERYANDGFYVKAIAVYKKAQRIENRLEFNSKLAELYHRQGLTTDARAHYQKLADHYQRQNDAASAIAVYQKLVELEENEPSWRVKLADLYRQEKLLSKAAAEYGNIATLMLDHGQADQALQVYLRALDLDPSNLEFWRGAIGKLMASGASSAAQELFTAALQKNSAVEELRGLLTGEIPISPAQEAAQTGLQEATAPPATQEPPAPPAPSPAAPAAPEPVAQQPLPPEPVARQPTPEPVAPEPVAPEPVAPKPVAPEPVAPEPMAPEPAAQAPVPPQVAGGEAAEPLPEIGPPTGSGPELPEPGTEPEAGGPGAAGEQYEEFVLDFDADEPSTLVKPPEDMMADVGGEPPVEAEEIEIEIEEPAVGETGGFSFQPEPELETPTLAPEDIDLELTDSQIQPAVREPAPMPPAAAPAPSAASPTAETLVPDQEEARPEDDLLAEAEVFVKYGLTEKAVDRLRDVLQANPRHLGAHGQLLLLFAEQGIHEEVRRLTAAMSQLAQEVGTLEPWHEVREKLEGSGYRFSGEELVGVPGGGEVPASGQTVAPSPPAPSMLEPGTPAGDVEMPPSGEVDLSDFTSEMEEVPSVDTGAVGGESFQTFAAGVPGEPGAAPGAETPSPADPTSWLDEVGAQEAAEEDSGESLFDDEEDFFDLAAELQEDLQEGGDKEGDEPREQTLEEIVEGFKKGVAENLSPEDSDTHYNLGIAYREMMLLDEAIGEFQIAAKDSRYLIDSCAMLGQCFSDKGLPQLAIKWYQKALDSPGIEDTQTLGMLYELGNSYLAVNDRDAAYKAFLEIYGLNSNYRDVSARIQELQPSGSHS